MVERCIKCCVELEGVVRVSFSLFYDITERFKKNVIEQSV